MPELPEVESVRRSLVGPLVGRTVASVEVHRPDVVTGGATPAALLVGGTIARVERHGKQLALVGEGGGEPCVCVHLGMTGSLVWRGTSAASAAAGDDAAGLLERPRPDHVHLTWHFAGGTLAFRDPRRFGGVWTYPTLADLRSRRWSQLGPDALTVTARQLHPRLSRSRRPLKAALLDQGLIAGLGNIYADELLFACELHPRTPCDRLSLSDVQVLVRQMRRVLASAVRSGGSTLRDYVNGEGVAGGYQLRHQVYGRGGEACRGCGSTLRVLRLGGRTTVWCARCQRLRRLSRRSLSCSSLS